MRSELIDSWRREERKPFAGWDFSYLEGRMATSGPPWSYENQAMALMAAASSLLDMDTGGGERLLQMRSAWPAHVVATEHHPPNVELARQRLEPEGARLVEAGPLDGVPLPFGDGSFDLVLNRHGGYQLTEVERVLRPGGVFFTQQVSGDWAHDLFAVFGHHSRWAGRGLATGRARLEQETQLTVEDASEWAGKLTFTDVGAIVYYLKALPWELADFGVDRHFELQRRLDQTGRLEFFAGNWLLRARKPAVGRRLRSGRPRL